MIDRDASDHGGPGGWLPGRLFDQRIVLLRGALSDEVAGAVAAQLMTLDATGDGAISLHLDSPGGPLSAAFTLMDTIDLCGVDVDVVAQGRVEGTALGVLAVGHHRRALHHTRFRLCLPTAEATFGRARDLEAFAEHYARDVQRFIARIAAACRRPAEHVEADLDSGRYITAEEAKALGFLDEVYAPKGAGGEPPRFPFGFQPPRPRER